MNDITEWTNALDVPAEMTDDFIDVTELKNAFVISEVTMCNKDKSHDDYVKGYMPLIALESGKMPLMLLQK